MKIAKPPKKAPGITILICGYNQPSQHDLYRQLIAKGATPQSKIPSQVEPGQVIITLDQPGRNVGSAPDLLLLADTDYNTDPTLNAAWRILAREYNRAWLTKAAGREKFTSASCMIVPLDKISIEAATRLTLDRARQIMARKTAQVEKLRTEILKKVETLSANQLKALNSLTERITQ